MQTLERVVRQTDTGSDHLSMLFLGWQAHVHVWLTIVVHAAGEFEGFLRPSHLAIGKHQVPLQPVLPVSPRNGAAMHGATLLPVAP